MVAHSFAPVMPGPHQPPGPYHPPGMPLFGQGTINFCLDLSGIIDVWSVRDFIAKSCAHACSMKIWCHAHGIMVKMWGEPASCGLQHFLFKEGLENKQSSMIRRTSSQFCKAWRFGRVAPTIFKYATEKENANLFIYSGTLSRTIWKVWCAVASKLWERHALLDT